MSNPDVFIEVFEVLLKHGIEPREFPQHLATCLTVANARVMQDTDEMTREAERVRLTKIAETVRVLVEAWTPTTPAEEAFAVSDPDDLPQA